MVAARHGPAIGRPGFGLVEVVIAALLLGGGLLTLAAAAVAARGRMTASAADEAAIRVAAVLLDSLRAEPEPGPGAQRVGGVVASWSTGAGRIELTLRYSAGLHGERERAFVIRSAAAVPREAGSP